MVQIPPHPLIYWLLLAAIDAILAIAAEAACMATDNFGPITLMWLLCGLPDRGRPTLWDDDERDELAFIGVYLKPRSA
ncbi:hypothetical protein AB6D20_027910 (plasmid) [Vibrio splendidus]